MARTRPSERGWVADQPRKTPRIEPRQIFQPSGQSEAVAAWASRIATLRLFNRPACEECHELLYSGGGAVFASKSMTFPPSSATSNASPVIPVCAERGSTSAVPFTGDNAKTIAPQELATPLARDVSLIRLSMHLSFHPSYYADWPKLENWNAAAVERSANGGVQQSGATAHVHRFLASEAPMNSRKLSLTSIARG